MPPLLARVKSLTGRPSGVLPQSNSWLFIISCQVVDLSWTGCKIATTKYDRSGVRFLDSFPGTGQGRTAVQDGSGEKNLVRPVHWNVSLTDKRLPQFACPPLIRISLWPAD